MQDTNSLLLENFIFSSIVIMKKQLTIVSLAVYSELISRPKMVNLFQDETNDTLKN